MGEKVDLAAWVGRRQVRADRVGATQLAAWNATLDLDQPFPVEGEPAPPGFHWTLFPPLPRQSGLGPDGHERRGTFLPPVALPRRMWAGSRLELGEGLRVGDRVERTSTIERVDVLLFRYSAVTFNPHRIHYDRRYATEKEGYPGLVVHAPLIATLLLELLRRHRPAAPIARFHFKALRPTFDTAPFTVEGAPGAGEGRFELWSTDNQGEVGLDAEAWLR